MLSPIWTFSVLLSFSCLPFSHRNTSFRSAKFNLENDKREKKYIFLANTFFFLKGFITFAMY